jgi:hypothetical protein
MKKIIIQTIVILSPILSFGQEIIKATEIKRNSIYIEAFGQGLYNSFSFDRLYNVDKKVKTSFSAGLTIIPHPELFVLGIPVSYNYLFGQKNHHLELGLGITGMYLRHGRISASESVTDINGVTQTNNYVGHQNDFYTYFTPKIGYRFQKNSGGLFLRLTLTPSIAGINSIGGTQGGKLIKQNREIQYFKSAAFFEPYKIFPWAGISIGWTLKK